MKRRIFFLTAGSGGGTQQIAGQGQSTAQTTGQEQQSTSNQQTQTTENQTNQSSTQQTSNSQQSTSSQQTQNQTQTQTTENQTNQSSTQQTSNSQQSTSSQQTQNQTTGQNQVVYVSLDEVNKMLDERDAKNKSYFEKKDLVAKIQQDASLKGLLDKKFPKWEEKSLEQIKDIKTVYEGIIQTQLVSGASEKPGNISTQNSDVFISTGNATKDYENFCKFKREQKKKQQTNPTQTSNNTTSK